MSRHRPTRSLKPIFALGALLFLGQACSEPRWEGDADSGSPPDAAPHREIVIRDRPAGEGSVDHSAGHGPPYPLVLAHGFFGFDRIGPLNYFYGVKGALEAAGHSVYVTAVDPFNSTYVRGPQLLPQIQDILARSGSAKVNIIAHSQGGLDARWVAHMIPDRIGAVLTISTPHGGTRIADLIMENAPGISLAAAKAFVAAVSAPIYGDVADDANLTACMSFLTTRSITQFNQLFPPQPTVRYYSLAGRSNSDLAETACAASSPPDFVASYANVRDPIDPLLFLSSRIIGGSLFDPAPNDGIIEVSSAPFGTWLGCIPADHWDQIGQLLGDSPGPGNTFDYLQLYQQLAAFLVQQGY